MAIREINVTFEVDEDILKKEVESSTGNGYDFNDAINLELEWLHDSGIVTKSWKEVTK